MYITHLSILVILAGAIIGIYFGYNAFLNLPEGQISSVAYQDKGVEIPLGFDLRCDNFDVEYYQGADMPKAYRSWLTVMKNGKEVMKKSIVVNDPLTYEGVTFYQSSCGSVPNGTGNGILVLNVASDNGKSEQIKTKIGDTFFRGFYNASIVFASLLLILIPVALLGKPLDPYLLNSTSMLLWWVMA